MSRAQLTSTVEQNTGGAVAPFVAGKNFLINGGFDIWQRGTSSTTNLAYNTADRWLMYYNTLTTTFSQETSVVPTGSRYSLKVTQATANSYITINQAIETANAIQLAGKTVTFSSSIQATVSTSVVVTVSYSTSTDVGVTGSWTAITPNSGGSITANTSWQQLIGTYNIPSTAKSILVNYYVPTLTVGNSVYFAQAQLEVGSVATPFSRAGATLQGELALCQRYLPAITNVQSSSNNTDSFNGYAYQTNGVLYSIPFSVPARVPPTGITLSGTFSGYGLNTPYTITPLFNAATNNVATVYASTGITITAGQGSRLGILGGSSILFTGCEL